MIFKDEILNSLENVFQKYDCALVGGYLRNYFLKGEISPDRDIVVIKNAKKLALEAAQATGGTFVELDCDNEIYRVVLKDKLNFFDISKALNDNFEDDIKRRDFTINSICYDLNKKEIYDPQSGREDIKKGIIRTCDFKNLLDDPLRMFRMYRFMALTGFRAEDELRKFTCKNFKQVLNCAMERINYEIIHMFEGEYIARTLEDMFNDSTLEVIFPFVSQIKKIPPNSHHHLDLIHHSIETVRNIRINKPLLKIAAFCHDIGKPSTWTIEEDTGRHRFIGHDIQGGQIASKELLKLKFSKAQIAYISKMVRYHIYPATLVHCEDSKKAFARFVRKLGEEAPDVIELSRADRLSARGEAVSDEMVKKALGHLENLLEYYNNVKNEVKNPKPLLNGREIMDISGLKPCARVGEIIEQLIEQQLMGNILTREDAIEFIKHI